MDYNCKCEFDGIFVPYSRDAIDAIFECISSCLHQQNYTFKTNHFETLSLSKDRCYYEDYDEFFNECDFTTPFTISSGNFSVIDSPYIEQIYFTASSSLNISITGSSKVKAQSILRIIQKSISAEIRISTNQLHSDTFPLNNNGQISVPNTTPQFKAKIQSKVPDIILPDKIKVEHSTSSDEKKYQENASKKTRNAQLKVNIIVALISALAGAISTEILPLLPELFHMIKAAL